MVYSFYCVAIQKSEDMNVQRVSADIALLVCNNCEGDESSSARPLAKMKPLGISQQVMGCVGRFPCSVTKDICITVFTCRKRQFAFV